MTARGRGASLRDAQVTLALGPDVLAALDRLCAARGQSRAEVVRELVGREAGLADAPETLTEMRALLTDVRARVRRLETRQGERDADTEAARAVAAISDT